MEEIRVYMLALTHISVCHILFRLLFLKTIAHFIENCLRHWLEFKLEICCRVGSGFRYELKSAKIFRAVKLKPKSDNVTAGSYFSYLHTLLINSTIRFKL